MTQFTDLDLIEPLCRALERENYEHPTPIQANTIPLLLKGRDVLGCAQTGTGKTAAFALPLLQRLSKRPNKKRRRSIKALVLSPTRELAAQINSSFGTYGRYVSIQHTVIFGGVGQTPQVKRLRQGIDVLVATPGRLLDLIGQGHVDLSRVEYFVLDEADRMLDMGFIHDIKKVMGHLPKNRQNLLFSATMPRSIRKLGSSFLKDPAWIEVSPETKTVDSIEQRVMFVSRGKKRHLLADLIPTEKMSRVLVFTRTKHGANRLVKQLGREGQCGVAIHGNKSQKARRVALEDFKSGKSPILVATDLASRGIDVDDISHVVNFDLPNEAETYVHRIGRTGRAGREGVAISFCDETEGAYLRDIEKLVGYPIPVDRQQPYHCQDAEPIPGVAPPPPPASHFGNRGRRGGPKAQSPRRNGNGARRRRSRQEGFTPKGSAGRRPWKNDGTKRPKRTGRKPAVEEKSLSRNDGSESSNRKRDSKSGDRKRPGAFDRFMKKPRR